VPANYEPLREPQGIIRRAECCKMGTIEDHEITGRSEPRRAPLTAFEADEPAGGEIAGIEAREEIRGDIRHSPPPSFIQESPTWHEHEFMNLTSNSGPDSIVDDFIHSRKVIGDEEMGELVSWMSAYDPYLRK
jgi:hypothetical protein